MSVFTAQSSNKGSTTPVPCWQRLLQANQPEFWLSRLVRLLQVGKKGSAEDVAEALAAKAQEAGSTDDVTVVALKLG